MQNPRVSVVILAAGQGTRMKTSLPKMLHPLCGRPMIAWVIDQALALDPERIVLVTGHSADEVARAARDAAGDADLTVVVQEPQLGTGHAVQVAAPALGDDPGCVVVLYGDMPLLSAETLDGLIAARADGGPFGTAVLSAFVDDPTGYGRIIRDGDDALQRIVEERDANPDERAVQEINLGVYAFSGEALLDALPRLSNENDQNEYYLTDLLEIFVKEGRPVEVCELLDEDEGHGVNTVAQLSHARFVLQMRILEQHMAHGVLIVDPATTYIDADVTIGAGTHILPCTYIHAGVVIGEHCEVGPFTQLRPGTVLKDRAEVGNFTECKNSTLGEGSKAKHLSYLGDAHVGANANIGAGTIFANYDGKKKHRTEVGDGAFIGSGTIVVAPNTVPAGVTTGAGAVVTRSAEPQEGETWIGMPARKLGQKD